MSKSVWVALLAFFIYTLSYSGVIHSIDEVATVGVTESFLHGTLDVNRMAWEQRRSPPQNAVGNGENLYSKKGLGSPLLILPFFYAGKKTAAVGAVQLAFVSTALVTAAILFIFHRLVLSLGYSGRVAVLGALALGFGTLLWPYATMMFSEPLAALGLVLALWGTAAYEQTNAKRWLMVCSSGLAILILSRSANGVLTLPFGLWMAWRLGQVLWGKRPWLGAAVAFAVPVGAAVAVVCLYNYVRFGSYFSFPLAGGEAFTTPLLTGLVGLLFSPGKGLLFYVPLSGLVIVSYVVGWSQMKRPVFGMALAAVVITLLFYGRWYDWFGGKAWGPRFLVTVMPALVLLCLPAMQWLTAKSGRRWVLGGWLALSVLAQLPGVLINFEYQETLDGKAGATLQGLIWDWRWSPLLTYWNKVFSGAEDPVWFHAFWRDNNGWLLLLIVGLAVLLLGIHLWLGRRFYMEPERPLPAWVLWAAGVGTAVLAVSMVASAYGDPRWWERSATFATNQAVRERLVQQATAAGDVVLLDLPYPDYDTAGRVAEWNNFGPLYPDYIAWERPTDFTEVKKQRLQNWLSGYERVWLVQQDTAVGDPAATTEQWLKIWGYEGVSEWVDAQRITAFVLPFAERDVSVEERVVWQTAAPLQGVYTLQTNDAANHVLLDLTWLAPPPPEYKFSVQVRDKSGSLWQQIDRPLGSTAAQADRVGVTVPEGGYEIILVVYQAADGQVVPAELSDGTITEIIVLAYSPQ